RVGAPQKLSQHRKSFHRLTGPPDEITNGHLTYWRSPMRTVARAVLPVLLVAVALVPAAHADTMYSYVGDYFGTINGQPRVSGVYTTADRITGSFTVAEGFIPGAVLGGASFTGGGFYSDGTQAPAGL